MSVKAEASCRQVQEISIGKRREKILRFSSGKKKKSLSIEILTIINTKAHIQNHGYWSNWSYYIVAVKKLMCENMSLQFSLKVEFSKFKICSIGLSVLRVDENSSF